MSQFTLLCGARQLLTLHGPECARRGQALQQLGIIENGSVLIQDDRIFAVGPARRIENLKEARHARLVDASGCVVMPGLTDPDFHLNVREQRGRSQSHIYDEGIALLRSCLQHGTLSAVVKASIANADIRTELSLLRLIGRLSRAGIDTVRNWYVQQCPQSSDETLQLRNALNAAVRRRLIQGITVASNILDGPVSDWLSALLDCDLPIMLKWSGGVAHDLQSALDQLRPVTVSCPTSISDDEVRVLIESNAMALFAPGTELGRSSGNAPRKLVDAGCAVALSSGHHPVDSPGFSMQMAVSLAILNGGLTYEEAISAATVNAAYAAGIGHSTGTLEKGKRANLLVMAVPDYRDIARLFGVNHVSMVIADGLVLYEGPHRTMVANATAALRVRAQHL